MFANPLKNLGRRLRQASLGAALALTASFALALPTVEAVQAEVKLGHYSQAESMMREVVQAKPRSAKAHYVYAEILAHNGRVDEATRELSAAREIDPAIRFADPNTVRGFEYTLERARREAQAPAVQTAPAARMNPAPAPQPERSSGIPLWVWGGLLAVVGLLLWRGFQRSRRESMMAASPALAGYGGGVSGGGYGPGYGGGYPVGQAPSAGSGLLGVGLAAAGGVAAGMLAEKLLHGDAGNANAASRDGSAAQNFEPSPQVAMNDLAQREVDFGTGNDWGGDSGGGDAGGGGDDGGW